MSISIDEANRREAIVPAPVSEDTPSRSSLKRRRYQAPRVASAEDLELAAAICESPTSLPFVPFGKTGFCVEAGS